MTEDQTSFSFNLPISTEPAVPNDILTEIAEAWSLPLGAQVEVFLQSGDVESLAGKLELVSVPSFPWDSRKPLTLKVTGFIFSSRDIEHWVRR